MAFLCLAFLVAVVLAEVDQKTLPAGFVVNFKSTKDVYDGFTALEVTECVDGGLVNYTCDSRFGSLTLDGVHASFFIQKDSVPLYNPNGTDWVGKNPGVSTATRALERGIYFIGLYPDCSTTTCPKGNVEIELSCYAYNGTALIPPRLTDNRRTARFGADEGTYVKFWFTVEPQDLLNGAFVFYLDVTLAEGHKSQTEVFINKAANSWPTKDKSDYQFGVPGREGDYLWEKQQLDLGMYYGAVYIVKFATSTGESSSITKPAVTLKAGYNHPPTVAGANLVPSVVSMALILLSLFKFL
jgi:hypothetical protein